MVDYAKYFETDEVRPVKAWCDGEFLYAELADGRQIRAPLWWYPYLLKVPLEERSAVELLYEGIWWPSIDEGVSIKAMLLGRKAPGAKEPREVA